VEFAVTKEQLLVKSVEALAERWNLRDAPKWVNMALAFWLTWKTSTEPDFAKAFQAWRAAREKAMTEGKRVEFPEFRSEFWHLQMWLLGMLRRISAGSPGVSEDEFTQLLAWLEDNCRRLEPANEVRPVKLGNIQTSVWNVLLKMRDGPRQLEAGELAEVVRELKRTSAGEIAGIAQT
jgi:hypothetical protein